MNKRRSKRIGQRLTVDIGYGSHTHTGITGDISRHGLFVRTTKLCPPGSIVSINLQIPGNGSTTFKGKVIRTYRQHPYTSLLSNGLGVECDAPGDSYLTFISSLDS